MAVPNRLPKLSPTYSNDIAEHCELRSITMSGLGRALISFGIVLVIVGALVSLSDKLPWLGHLPGDIHIQRGRFSFYFPLTTCVIVSIVISLIAYWFKR